MNNQRPFSVTFIGDMTILWSLFLIATLFPAFLEVVGIDFGRTPVYSLTYVRVIMVIVSLIASVGFLKLKRWGYWLMMLNSVLFMVLDVVISVSTGIQPSYINVIQSVVWLSFIIQAGRYFKGRGDY